MWAHAAVALLGLALLNLVCQASCLGAVVTLQPVHQDGDYEVRAYTSVITPEPCSSPLREVCPGPNCSTHINSSPLRGLYPSPGWCLQQWQEVVSTKSTSRLQLSSETNVLLKSWADLSVRLDNQKVNQPPHVALLPPLRVSVNCFRRFPLRIRDEDGDRVQCRYANPEWGECQACSRPAFLQLEDGSCEVVYTGVGQTGQHTLELMVEDFNASNTVLSSTPLYFSLTVEEESTDCDELPAFTEQTPPEGAIFKTMPYEKVNITAGAHSSERMVLEIAVVGPPGLSVSTVKSGEEAGSPTSVNIVWLRSPNELPHLLPICFTANTNSSQSDTRCIWIEQKQMDAIPPGAVLKCGKTEMNLSFPIESLRNLPLDDLQLNDASCPIFHNDTHVMTVIPLLGCGTETVHLGTEMVFTNILQSVRAPSAISRLPTLLLHVTCRFPAVMVHGPHYNIAMPTEEQIFGAPRFWLEFHKPGEGPFANRTQIANGAQREKRSGVRSAHRLELLDLYVFSNTSLDRAELMVGSCMQSETPDFQTKHPFVAGGCVNSNRTLELITNTSTVKIYRLDLATLSIQGTTMYVQCKVHLCIAIKATQKCPDECAGQSLDEIVDSLITRTYTVRSGPVSILDEPPTTTAAPTTTKVVTTASHAAPEEASVIAVGVAVGIIHTFVCSLLH
ncbi:hypothetical protein AGOR_G00108200 [Albula goreensis]|uniref:ZP domain-containing protein n=1 Tax=Albula goreensis TaxID=1534307 RepID=A0A8T3DDS8_9TELE|nr:hypothetical protein AGOR_G00108200 [Albula goreensis]